MGKNTYTGSEEVTVPDYSTKKTSKYNVAKQQALISRFNCFGKLDVLSSYWITLCADVPDNKRPDRVLYHDQPGHVFIILTKRTITGDTINTAFGFYPRVRVICLFPHRLRSKIMDNGDREYDVQIRKKLTAGEFAIALENAARLASEKYHIKKYNCYDYAVGVFNSVATEKLAIRHVRFPFIFGKGGSPCGLYHDLKKIMEYNSGSSEAITFGSLRSPKSDNHKEIDVKNIIATAPYFLTN